MLTVDQAIAFLPQFVLPDRGDVLRQLALLGVAFIVQAAFLFNFYCLTFTSELFNELVGFICIFCIYGARPNQ